MCIRDSLTRRLVDVAQDGVVLEEDCGTLDGIEMTALIESGEIIENLGDRVLGRVLLEDLVDPEDENKILIEAGKEVTEEIKDLIDQSRIEKVKIRSVLTCNTNRGVCKLCYGRDLSRGKLVSLGETIGVIAAQSIGEPGTQLTMRTFHIGGAASSSSEENAIFNKNSGVVNFSDDMKTVTNKDKLEVVVSRNAMCSISDANGKIIEQYKVPYGATLEVANSTDLEEGIRIASWDPYTRPIISETSGKVKFTDIQDGITVREQLDELTGLSSVEIIEVADRTSAGRDMSPTIEIVDSKGKPVLIGEFKQPAVYPLPAGGLVNLVNGQKITAGEVIARMPLVASKTKDITGGLPRVAELFEARRPKDSAIIAENDGVIEFGKEVRGKQKISIVSSNGETSNYLIPKGKHVNFNQGEKIKKGEYLLDGSPAPHDILRILGVEKLTEYFVTEVQEVYRLQGVVINDKHIETIVRQMLKRVEIKDPGDSELLSGEVIDLLEINSINDKLRDEKKKPAIYERVLLGITKASLQTNSFISAASFQETTRVLTDASIKGKTDTLEGLKENVIVGRLVPAGTGLTKIEWDKQAREQDKKRIEELKKQELESASVAPEQTV